MPRVIVDREPPPSRRFILLGASNLTRGLSKIVTVAHRTWGTPLDVVAAIGHGRSYGNASRVLVRSLPGILSCGIWQALAERGPVPSVALVSDIGNDLFYNVKPQQITAWVGECIDRLQAAGTRVIVTGLPVCNLGRVVPAQFAVLRQILFPGCQLTFEAAKASALELNELVAELTRARGASLVEPQAHWYGLDPIHIRLRHHTSAWQTILGAANECATNTPNVEKTRATRINLLMLKPAQRWLAGFEQRGLQPCARLRDGSQLSLY